MSEDGKIKDLAVVVGETLKAIPVYIDAVQPAAKEVGKSLETLAKTINICLAPLKGLIWGYDKIADYLSGALEARLKEIPPSQIITPNPIIAGPIIESLRFAANEQTLRDLYANLLATAMDSATAKNAHPSFVDIIRQLIPDEAKIINKIAKIGCAPVIRVLAMKKGGLGYITKYNNFSLLGNESGCDCPELTPYYLDNLERLKLLDVRYDRWFVDKKLYEPLLQHPKVKEIEDSIKLDDSLLISIENGMMEVTLFGGQFVLACIGKEGA
jgi:hypothetical protein